MALALNLLLDPATSATVSQLWRDLANEGISSDMLGLGYPPHLTLLVMDDEGLSTALVPALGELARLAPGGLLLGDVHTFAGTEVVYLSCGGDMTRLRELHRSAASLLPEDSVRPYYRPGIWTPHVTLQTIGDVARSIGLARGSWQAGRAAVVTRLELATFVPVVVGDGIDLAS